ncbi:hypothetical protein Sme01_45060 [Sphaerisporangium melleum]|uniref:Uncharacterized protein n=1 Tax=Sphaerisporangium melleum TaxID=321316 RepID=A0A917QZX4_9ACTN|nr:hypothetical protein GCM10007964_24030 [Sphaerisporangium melleum]GII72030.1 hypothetical protein Sme01_45060 [Sphaerisporangium melleum]
MDLMPALAGGLRAFPILYWWPGLGPAGTVSGYFFQDGLAEVVPQVPAISDLDRVRQRPAHRFGVGA